MDKIKRTKKSSYIAPGAFICEVYVGPPGCGKTTRISSLVKSAIADGGNPLICSLTRSAAAEVAGRGIPIPKQNIGTLHSHALHALDRPVLVEKHLGDWSKRHPHLAMGQGGASTIDPYARQLDRGPELMSKLDLYRAKCVPPEIWPTDVSSFATLWQSWKDERHLMDFTDLIALAIDNDTVIPHDCDMIFVDEAQDMSRLEQKLLHHWALQVTRLVIVGDPWQSLYGWRGAAPEMFDSSKIKAVNRHVLTQSYRVPKAVHAAAVGLAKQLSDYSPIEYHPTNEQGSVTQPEYGISFPVPIVQRAAQEAEAGRTVMIAAPCGYMLNPLIEELRRTGTPFANPWRTKNGRWNPLQGGRGVSMGQRIHEFMIPIEGVSLGETNDGDILDDSRNDPAYQGPRSWTIGELARWSSALTGVLMRGAKKEIQRIGKSGGGADLRIVTSEDVDRWFEFVEANELMSIMDGMIDRNTALAWYDRHLSRDKKKPAEFAITIARRHGTARLRTAPKIYVGTIHSFKGAEADTVFLIPDLSASGYREWSGSPKQRDSVIRMFYVGMTRAKKNLILCQASTSRAANIWETT